MRAYRRSGCALTFIIDERLARAALEPTELPIAAAIFEHLNRCGSPAERVERIVRFAISQPVRIILSVRGLYPHLIRTS